MHPANILHVNVGPPALCETRVLPLVVGLLRARADGRSAYHCCFNHIFFQDVTSIAAAGTRQGFACLKGAAVLFDFRPTGRVSVGVLGGMRVHAPMVGAAALALVLVLVLVSNLLSPQV